MVGGKKVWNLNCVLSGMGILKAHVDDDSQTVLKMEKNSIMDYVKKMPAGMMPEAKEPETKKELEDTVQKLSDMQKEIEKEKEEYSKKLKDPKNMKEPKDQKTLKSKPKKG